MKHLCLFILLFIAVSIAACFNCNDNYDIPEGCWVSLQSRPSFILKKDSCGSYLVIVHHPVSGGNICSVTYPVVRKAAGMYIQAEGRIYLSYSQKDGILFLSPGGKYRLKGN